MNTDIDIDVNIDINIDIDMYIYCPNNFFRMMFSGAENI